MRANATRFIVMIRVMIACFVTVGMTLSTSAQTNVLLGGGAATTSTATAAVGWSGLDGYMANPAAIYKVDSRFGLDVGVKSRFGVEELNTASLGGFYAFKGGTVGAQFVRYGFEAFYEQKATLTYARRLAKTVGLGANANLISLSIEEFGSKSVPTIDLGFVAEVNRTVTLSSSVLNLTSSGFADELNVPTRVAVAATYRPNSKVGWTVEFDKSIETEFAIKTALIYEVVPSLQLRTGIDFTREEFGLGVSYTFGQVQAIGAYSYDTLLGATPAASLRYYGK